MGKYRITTDQGVFEITTDETPTGAPLPATPPQDFRTIMASPQFRQGQVQPFVGAAKNLAQGAYSGLQTINRLQGVSLPDLPESMSPQGIGERAGSAVMTAGMMAPVAEGVAGALASRMARPPGPPPLPTSGPPKISPNAIKAGRFLLRRVPYVGKIADEALGDAMARYGSDLSAMPKDDKNQLAYDFFKESMGHTPTTATEKVQAIQNLKVATSAKAAPLAPSGQFDPLNNTTIAGRIGQVPPTVGPNTTGTIDVTPPPQTLPGTAGPAGRIPSIPAEGLPAPSKVFLGSSGTIPGEVAATSGPSLAEQFATPTLPNIRPQGIAKDVWDKLPEQGKKQILQKIAAGETKPVVPPGLTAPRVPPPTTLPAPAGAEVPAAPASTAVSAPPAPTTDWNRAFPLVKGGKIGDISIRPDTPNWSSVGASFNNYEELPGVREVPLSAFDYKPPAKLDARTQKLADQIKASKELNPLIVAIDEKGPYVLEGGHRLDSSYALGHSSVPARVVIDRDAVPRSPMPESLPAPTRPLHTEADVIDNFSTRRKVDNLTRHFWSKGVPYEELKAMYDKAKATGNWDAIRQKELEAYASGKALEEAGNYNPLELVPKTKYKPPSGSQAAKEAGYTPQGVEGTWDRLLQRYPRTTPMQLGALPAPQPVAQ